MKSLAACVKPATHGPPACYLRARVNKHSCVRSRSAAILGSHNSWQGSNQASKNYSACKIQTHVVTRYILLLPSPSLQLSSVTTRRLIYGDMGSWTASGFSFPQHQQQHDAAPTQAVHGHAGAASPSLSPTTDRHLTLSVPPTYNDSDSMGRAARPRPAPLQLHKQRSSNNEKYNPFLSPIPQSPLSPTTSVLASGLPLSMGPPGLGDTNGITAPSIPRRTLGRARLRLLLLGMTLLVVSLLSFSSDPSEALLLDVPSSSSDGIEQEASTMFESFASRAKALPKSLKHRLQRLPQYHLCREPDLFDNDWAPTVPVPENVEKHVQDVMQKTEVFAPSLTGQTPDGKHTPTVVTEAPPAVVSLAPELPVIPGFGNALSNPNNPTRAKCVAVKLSATA